DAGLVGDEVARGVAALLALLPERIELGGELGEQLLHHLGDEAGLDALDRGVARLHGDAGEAALVGDLLVDEPRAVGDDAGSLLGIVDRVAQAHGEHLREGTRSTTGGASIKTGAGPGSSPRPCRAVSRAAPGLAVDSRWGRTGSATTGGRAARP